jgi:hypothetical protein
MPAKKSTAAIMRCNVPGGFHAQGLKDEFAITVTFGQMFRADDPIVKKYGEFFSPVDEFDAPVEQATAAPGEKRNK